MKARILVAVSIEGNEYQPNDVVDLSASLIKAFADGVDTDPAAVSYCVDELKAVVIKHSITDEEKARIADSIPVLTAPAE